MNIAVTIAAIRAYRPGRFVIGSGSLFIHLSVRALFQTVLFIQVARALGVDHYGAFVAVHALAILFVSLASFGAPALLVRDGARRPNAFVGAFGATLKVWIVAAPISAITAFTITVAFLPDTLPGHAVAAIVIAELICATMIEIISRAYQSQEQMSRMGAVITGLVVVRLLMFVTLTPIVEWTATSWAWAYLSASLLYTAGLMVFALHQLGRPAGKQASLSAMMRNGFPFAFAGSAQRIQAEANKPLLARLDSLAGAGAFAVAHRVSDLVLLPLTAMIETLRPRVYRDARPGWAVLQFGSLPLVAAIIGGAALFVSAPLLPRILGESYAAAVPAAQMLAGLPFMIVIRSLLTLLIVAASDPRHFVAIYGLGALTSIVLNAILIPHIGMSGAVVAAYCTEIILIGIQGVLLARHYSPH